MTRYLEEETPGLVFWTDDRVAADRWWRLLDTEFGPHFQVRWSGKRREWGLFHDIEYEIRGIRIWIAFHKQGGLRPRD